MKKEVAAEVTSKKGFYVGDLCYVLADDLYYDVWGGKYGYRSCVFTDPDTGLRVAVADTAFGDGCYIGSDGTKFPVDAGNIGVVPLELVTKELGLEDGKVTKTPGSARFMAENGQFKIELPDGKFILTLHIDTSYESDYDDEDDEDDDRDENE